MPQGAFYVFADASRWTHDSYALAFELLEKAGVGVAPGVDFGLAGKRFLRVAISQQQHAAAFRHRAHYLDRSVKLSALHTTGTEDAKQVVLGRTGEDQCAVGLIGNGAGQPTR